MTRALQAGTVIADRKAYLTTAVTRLGINYLRSARVRRETYVGDWLPEPVVVPLDAPGPAEHAELADSLSMAFLVLLEALSPVERAVFMLREVFGYDYSAVARVTGKGQANCRQIFARARQRILAGAEAAGGVPVAARRAEGEELARRFFDAAAGGDMNALLGMLAPDVVLHGDGGGKAQAMGVPLAGRERVLRLLGGLFRRGRFIGGSYRPAWVNGQPGAVTYDAEGRVVNVFELDVADGVVQTIRSVVNPDKLGHLGPVSDVALLPRRELTGHLASEPCPARSLAGADGPLLGAGNPVRHDRGELVRDFLPGEVAGRQDGEFAAGYPVGQVTSVGYRHQRVVGAGEDVHRHADGGQQVTQHAQLLGVAAYVAR
jgi:RNA polymerase sigma-70 factor (ECF subfamily)